MVEEVKSLEKAIGINAEQVNSQFNIINSKYSISRIIRNENPNNFSNLFGDKFSLNEACQFALDKGRIVKLAIVGIQFEKYHDCLLKLNELEEIFIQGADIKLLDIDFSVLKKLKIFDLEISDIELIGQKFNLPESILEISLVGNKIKSFPFPDINKYTKLKSLDLSHNKIEILPSELFVKSKLQIAHDKLVPIRKSKNNVVKQQKYEEAARLRDEEKQNELKYGQGLSIENNPLILPPIEFVLNPFYKLEEYVKTVLKDLISLKEVKSIFVGEGASGKTSLLKMLNDEEFNEFEQQTHGINISSQSFKKEKDKIKINFWDFGGQQIMHATHQFFLSKRCLYVVVVDSRRDPKIEYWLKHVSSFGGNSPIIVALNKIDENPGFRINRKFLKEKYPNINGFYRISCKTGEGVDELKNGILNAVENVEILKSFWNKKWIPIKEHLESATDNFISFTEFRKLCKSNGVPFNTQQDLLMEVLNDLGIILNFRDLELTDTKVINPHWLTEGIYKIINSKALAENEGLFRREDFEMVLDKSEYPREKYHYLLSLMKKFQICYQVDEDSILIPDLLSVDEPEIPVKSEIEIVFMYNFLPKSILPRLIVGLHRHIYKGFKWRTGVILKHPMFDAFAVVVEDFEEKRIRISLGGTYRRSYFSIIFNFIQELNSQFTSLNCDVRIFMDNAGLETNDVSVSYSHLVKLEAAGIEEFIPEGLDKPVKVKSVLDIVSSEEDELEEIHYSLDLILHEMRKMTDKEVESFEINKLLELKPNIAGMGLDLNYLIDYLKGKKKGQSY